MTTDRERANGRSPLLRRERIPVEIEEHGAIAIGIARRIADVIRSCRKAGETPALGLATGSTPIGIYRELIRMHREEGLSFGDVVTFNLDEYYPMEPESIHSYHRYMWENLFDHIDIDPEKVHIPDGTVPREAIEAAGGIDFQILGIGKTGHIGFNEPGSGVDSRTRRVALDTITRRDASANFFGEDNVPTEAITMGVATILDAKEIAIVATGEHKAEVVRRAVEGSVDPDIAATYLQGHPNVTFYVDPAAAARLTRVRTPWILGEVDWTPEMEMQAVVWLGSEIRKSVLRLDNLDYRENHLSSLLAKYGSAAPLNGEIFNRLITKIRGRSKLPSGKRIIVFSPHPDDDVISMGGMLNKLHQNGNDITVAYQTSGNIAVFDHEVERYMDFLRRFGRDFEIRDAQIDELLQKIERFLDEKEPGAVDSPEVQKIKRSIREAEAVNAIETFGMTKEQACFQNLPFYQTGKVKKDPVGERDVEITLDLLRAVRPELIFVAGDLSDPHGTHRMCMEAVDRALERYDGDSPEVWYYRGAWQEWSVEEADVLVPLSEQELRLKIMAIFRHESQKDRAPFPGIDDREFWERVEERNTATARTIDDLGLPEYFAMEAYVVRKDGRPLEMEVVPTSSLHAPLGAPPREPRMVARSGND